MEDDTQQIFTVSREGSLRHFLEDDTVKGSSGDSVSS